MDNQVKAQLGGYGFETAKAVTGTSSMGKLTLAQILAP
jgi:hypothetical protein